MEPGHRLVEETSLALHRAGAERMRSDPAVLEAARARVAGGLRNGGIDRRVLLERLGSLPVDPARREAIRQQIQAEFAL